jgi:hypothetical protein
VTTNTAAKKIEKRPKADIVSAIGIAPLTLTLEPAPVLIEKFSKDAKAIPIPSITAKATQKLICLK